MALRLYNTLTKKEEDFIPTDPKRVTVYTCGPTVYGRPHIGNYASFLMADLLVRWLEHGHGYTVVHAKNITDVGHLVADQDAGEDKIEKQAKAEKLDPLAIAKKYENEYLADEKILNFREPQCRPRATAYIKEMLAITKKLLVDGHAYETDDGIYFDVQTFPAYGKLSGNTLDKLDAGARVKVKEEKKHPADFALWKKCVGENSHHILRWSFATGERVDTEGDDATAGFPGWHIECSAMSQKCLGDTIDIHTGGEDNIFPHHECEIAQSESVTGKPFVKLWLHRRRIDIGEQKMSKSLGNVLSVPNILAKGYSAQDLRFYLLSVHYRTNLKFSEKGLDDARKARRKIMEWMFEVDKLQQLIANHPSNQEFDGTLPALREEFIKAMDQDLNVSAALAVVFEAINFTNQMHGLIPDALTEYLWSLSQLVKTTFGCFEPEEEAIPADVQKLVSERSAARAQKNFSESDRLRDEITKLGYEVRDQGSEQVVKKL